MPETKSRVKQFFQEADWPTAVCVIAAGGQAGAGRGSFRGSVSCFLVLFFPVVFFHLHSPSRSRMDISALAGRPGRGAQQQRHGAVRHAALPSGQNEPAEGAHIGSRSESQRERIRDGQKGTVLWQSSAATCP